MAVTATTEKLTTIGIIVCVVIILAFLVTVIVSFVIAASTPDEDTESVVGDPPISMAAFNRILSMQDRYKKRSGIGFKDRAFNDALADYVTLKDNSLPYSIAVPVADCPADVKDVSPLACDAYHNNRTEILDLTGKGEMSGNRVGGAGWEGIAEFRAERLPDNKTLELQFAWGDRVAVVFVYVTIPSSEKSPSTSRHFIIDVSSLGHNVAEWSSYGRDAEYRSKEGILQFRTVLTDNEATADIINVTVLPALVFIKDPVFLHMCEDGVCYGPSYSVDIGRPT